jgi:hypothetical protein
MYLGPYPAAETAVSATMQATGSSSAAGGGERLSDYEQLRLANIRRYPPASSAGSVARQLHGSSLGERFATYCQISRWVAAATRPSSGCSGLMLAA